MGGLAFHRINLAETGHIIGDSTQMYLATLRFSWSSCLVGIGQAAARSIAVLISGLIAGGCTQIDLDSRVARQSHVYVGAVRVNIPATYGELRAIDVSTLGAGVDSSVFLGWRHGQFVYVRPDACQLLLIIRSPVETEHAMSILRAVEGDNLCVADFSGRTLPLR